MTDLYIAVPPKYTCLARLKSHSLYRPKRNAPILNLQHTYRRIEIRRFFGRKIHWSPKPSYMRDGSLAFEALPALGRFIGFLEFFDAYFAKCVVAGPYSGVSENGMMGQSIS